MSIDTLLFKTHIQNLESLPFVNKMSNHDLTILGMHSANLVSQVSNLLDETCSKCQKPNTHTQEDKGDKEADCIVSFLKLNNSELKRAKEHQTIVICTENKQGQVKIDNNIELLENKSSISHLQQSCYVRNQPKEEAY
mmetsp:Transcript_20556/g.17972  ORF Transcript_20556/g.17972 Transcript_20556/m.17972 type:complete len:138 (-) Transcript_20556:907-1320(-)